jgi:tRNA A-37 threonylcarbamoyl transferase component Bud32
VQRELIASGRTADVFALDEDRVLRRYRDDTDTASEAATMEYLRTQGFPAPRVFEADGPDLVLERLHGPTLAEAMMTGACSLERGATIIGDLHRSLHALPVQWSPHPAHAVLHRDLHALNIILTVAGPVLIDWTLATEGPPDEDVALTLLMAAQEASTPGSPFGALAAEGAAALLAELGPPTQLGLTAAKAFRLSNPYLGADDRAAVERAYGWLSAARLPRLAVDEG